MRIPTKPAIDPGITGYFALERAVEPIGAAIVSRGIESHHLPIIDADIPREPPEARWVDDGRRLRAHLIARWRILLHCGDGLGRTGMIAAHLLTDLGPPARAATVAVRAARLGAIGTEDQLRHVGVGSGYVQNAVTRDQLAKECNWINGFVWGASWLGPG